MIKKPVCLVLGAGAGIGGAVGKRFAREGYSSYLCRRSSQEGLDALIADIKNDGGDASGQLLNVIEENSIEACVEHIEASVGPIEVALYNIGAQIGDRLLEETSYKAFEMGWRLATFGLFRLASSLCPIMEKRGKGCLLVTSATSALRGNKGQHSHAAAMAGRRMLAQSLHAQYAQKGIHVAHIVIDSAVDAPDTLGKMLGPELFKKYKASKGKDGLVLPDSVAETYYHLATQHRSSWSFELDLRSFSDVAWWNTVAP